MRQISRRRREWTGQGVVVEPPGQITTDLGLTSQGTTIMQRTHICTRSALRGL